MKSEIVNPMPDSAAPPAMRGIVSPGASRPMRSFCTIAVAPAMPMSFPTTRPATTPHVSVEPAASASVAGSRRTPALASANTGSTTNAMYGPHSVCRRSLIEIESRRLRVASRA
jgi:hypothetical protein